jgi:hypothetical protein
MKKRLILSSLILLSFFSCKTVELESYTYDSENDFDKRGIIYSLPKNLIKVEIVYTMRQEFERINGVEIKSKEVIPDITIDKPINVSSILMPDKDYEFILTGERITNDFFTKSTLDFILTQNGILKSIDSDIDDKSIEFGESLIMTTANIARAVGDPTSSLKNKTIRDLIGSLGLKENVVVAFIPTDSIGEGLENVNNIWTMDQLKDDQIKEEKEEYDQELFKAIKDLNKKLIKTSKKEEVNLIKSKIGHLQSQIDVYQLKNKIFFKTTDIKYTVIIDPFETYRRDELYTTHDSITHVFSHAIYPIHLFPENTKVIPKIKISISYDPSKGLNQNSRFVHDSLINGIVVRHPSSSKIDLDIDEKLFANEVVFLGQLGNTSVLPIKVKRAGKIVTAIKFDPTTGAIAQHKIVATSSSQNIGKSLVKSSKTLQETIDYLNYEKGIKELNARKAELTLGNEITALKDTELADLNKQEKIIILQKRIDALNKEKDDNTDFDKAVKELEQKQRLLVLEIEIKKLQDQLKDKD